MLPDFIQQYHVPETLWEDIAQIALFGSFDFAHQLLRLKFPDGAWSSKINMNKICSAIREKRWTLTQSDLLGWAQIHQGYDAINTSNVYDHLLSAGIPQQEMAATLQHAVVPGGVVSLHNMYRSDNSAWTRNPMETEIWQEDWEIQKCKYPYHSENGDLYLLKRK